MADSKLPYFLLGIGAGAAAGLLYAPRAGRETREQLLNRAHESGDYVRRRGGELREQAEELLDRGRSAVHGQRDQLAAALEAGRNAYRDATGYQPGESDEQRAE